MENSVLLLVYPESFPSRKIWAKDIGDIKQGH